MIDSQNSERLAMKARVLIVDDDRNNLYLLESILTEFDFEVISAENGEDALAKARLDPPDLIVTDLLMPVMDGFTLCRQVKSSDTLKHIPLVFYTAEYTRSKDKALALSLGPDRFILKPQDPETLSKILIDLLEEKRTVKPTAEKPLGEEMEFFRRYNEILFSKLEKKMSDLETANQELKTLEERYRLSFENVTDVIYIIDTDRKFLSISPSVERLLGYKPEEFIGRSVSDLGHILTSESLERAISNLGLIFKGETVPAAIYEFIAKDGTIKSGEVNSTPIIRDGQVRVMVSVARDITERKRAEQSLRQLEERYRSIFENAQEGIFRATPAGRFIMANRAMARILGYDSPEELMDGITDITHQLYVLPEERQKAIELIERQGFARDDELQLRRKDGRTIWVYRTMRAIRDEKGKLLYYEGLIEDITDRKNSVDQLRKALGGTIQVITSLIETRDPYTAGHQSRVADLARSIAREMGLSNVQIEGIRIAGKIHDIGKISVPAEILSLPRKLTAIEFSLIKAHAQSGYDILKDIEFPWPIARMILQHHERLNGSGYPNGLMGENILLESRILSVADVVESMASHRPYRPALGIGEALAEIEKNKGTLYDNAVADSCLRLFRGKGYQIEDA
jgi:PAS domain S-box-containing protein